VHRFSLRWPSTGLHRPGSPNVSGHQRFRTTPIRPQRAEFVPIPARRRFPPLVGAVVGSSLVASLIVAGLACVGVVSPASVSSSGVGRAPPR